MNKQCARCKAWKPCTAFNRESANSDGLNYWCRECSILYKRNYRANRSPAQKELDKAKDRQYHKDWHKEQTKLAVPYWVQRWRTDPQYRISRLLRSRLSEALHRTVASHATAVRRTKVGSAVRDCGCTMAELLVHLERQFAPGMTWENWGQWHVDHRIPLCSFDLTDREQFLQACHYTNLQPLWATDNLRKGGAHLPQQIKAEERCGAVPVVAI